MAATSTQLLRAGQHQSAAGHRSDLMAQEAALFEPRTLVVLPTSSSGLWFGQGPMGHAHFTAPNPPHGVNFTYYLRDGYRSLKEERLAVEKNDPSLFPLQAMRPWKPNV